MTKKITLLLLLLATTIGFSQNQITGEITDNDGIPLGGVNVLLLNSSEGTISDFDGKYSIEATSRDTLEFSFMGFRTQRIAVKDQTIIDVVFWTLPSFFSPDLGRYKKSNPLSLWSTHIVH